MRLTEKGHKLVEALMSSTSDDERTTPLWRYFSTPQRYVLSLLEDHGELETSELRNLVPLRIQKYETLDDALGVLKSKGLVVED